MDGTTLRHKAGEATDGGQPLVAGSDLEAPRGLEVGEKSADEIRREIEARHEEADQLRCRAVQRAQIDPDLHNPIFCLRHASEVLRHMNVVAP